MIHPLKDNRKMLIAHLKEKSSALALELETTSHYQPFFQDPHNLLGQVEKVGLMIEILSWDYYCTKHNILYKDLKTLDEVQMRKIHGEQLSRKRWRNIEKMAGMKINRMQ